MDSEKIGSDPQPVNEVQFIDNAGAHLRRYAFRITGFSTFPGKSLQMLLGGCSFRHRLIGIFIAQFIKREGAGLSNSKGAGKSVFVTVEKASHFPRGLQMALGIGGQPETSLVNCAFFTDAGEDILQRPAIMVMIKNIIGGNERHPVSPGKSGKAIEARAVAAGVKHGGGKMERGLDGAPDLAQLLLESLIRQAWRRQGDENHAILVPGHIGKSENAAAFLGPPLAYSEERAQSSVG